ncbi:MAG TPA: thioredoxin fold domain-containing protein [Steroidobacteraceae bacterium]|nr:thioredoxin fold domain-containing protein [Steroidobacteraceae bacterium]
MIRSWLCFILLLVVLPAMVGAAGFDGSKLRNAIRAHEPAAQVAEPTHSPVPGMYLTSIDGVSGYVSADGRYFIVGDMLDLASHRNVTEESRQAARRSLLKQVEPNEAIVFAPAKPKYTVIVFTDVDCPYCRKLHGELGQLAARGIAVRYLAFPRSGPNTKAWRTMAAVWCSSDRRDALTRATRGDDVSVPGKCSDAVIAKHYALGQQLGIPGTPMVVLSDGTSLGGYMSPDKMLAALEEQGAGPGG